MRAAWLLTLLLLLAPLGLAQDGSQSGSPTADGDEEGEDEKSCSTAPDPEQCRADEDRRCRAHPRNEDPRCREHGNRTGDDEDDREREGCESHNESAEDACEEKVRRLREGGRDWISFTVDAPNATLRDYTVSSLLVLKEVRMGLDGDNLTIERQGSTLRVTDGRAELRLHDEPNGLIRFKGEAGNVTLVFPAETLFEHGERATRVGYGSGRTGHLLAENATWLDANVVRLDGFFAFHVPARGAPAQDRPADPEVEERKQEAIERRTVGAEVTLKPRPPTAPRLAAAANESIEILAYDDVEVEVDAASLEDPDVPLRVVVSSELDEGRTIVLNVDEALLQSTDPSDLLLRYFDLHNQTDGSVVETEVVFVQASSLQDVLEPMDDGGQPEYWVVEDANGVQVLVSVPHWSSHAITVASVSTALHAPSVAVGIVVGAGASIVMGALLLWPRRRDDEL